MEPLKILQIGNSLGIILSKEILAKLNSGKDDLLYVSEVPDGIKIKSSYAHQMELAEEIMHKDREILKKTGRIKSNP